MQKIYACPNDCILYRGEYENLDACPICSALRYKIRKDDPGNVEGERPRKRVPTKVMWYSPIIPHLKRLFRNKYNAKLMRWQKEERKKDSMLRHPADGSQWRKIDRTYPEFDLDACDSLSVQSSTMALHETKVHHDASAYHGSKAARK